VGTKRGHIELSVDFGEGYPDWLGPTLAGLGLALIVGLMYQLMVGGIKIEATGGRLTIDPSGFIYWWRTVTGH